MRVLLALHVRGSFVFALTVLRDALCRVASPKKRMWRRSFVVPSVYSVLVPPIAAPIHARLFPRRKFPRRSVLGIDGGMHNDAKCRGQGIKQAPLIFELLNHLGELISNARNPLLS